MMKVMRKTRLAAIVLFGCVAAAVIATELPTHDELDTTIKKVVSVLEVWIMEAHASSRTEGPNSLDVAARVLRTVCGREVKGDLTAKYHEHHAPDLSHEGLHVSYANYTGSGQELRTQSGDRVLMLISEIPKGTNACTIVRIEPLSQEKRVADAFKKHHEK